jgi:hypothetical protein
MAITRALLLFLAGLAGAGLGCEDGPEFAFNERIFEYPSMKPAGSGCTAVKLGGGSGGTGVAGGSDGSTLAITVSFADEVVVTVKEAGRLLFQRTYDEAFLRSGRLDEFIVTASAGQGRLLRYWSSFDAGGRPHCAPLEEDRPLPP